MRRELAEDVPNNTITTSFVEFVTVHERRLRHALTAVLGPDLGRDATAEALAHAWEHWERVSTMESPGAYLFVVGRDRGRRQQRRRSAVLPPMDGGGEPWFEPGLPDALASLSETQRAVVLLVDGFDWTMAEVAEYLGISKSTVQTHHDRGLAKLRRRLKVVLHG